MSSSFLFNKHDRIACVAFEFFRFLFNNYTFALHVDEAVFSCCLRFFNHNFMQSYRQLLIITGIQ